MGFSLTFADVPLLWKSKLQDCITLSTMESECIALSTAMQSLIHVHTLLHELSANFNLACGDKISTMSTVFEDNCAAQILTPCSKSLTVKCHWFGAHLGKKKGIIFEDAASKLNKADFVMKSLTKDPFQANHLTVSGWWTHPIMGEHHAPARMHLRVIHTLSTSPT